MKKQITFFASLMVIASATAQVKSIVKTATTLPESISLPSDKGPVTPTVTTKADGDLLWSDDFGGTVVWTIGTSGQGTFEIGSGTPNLTTYMGAMASTSAANGFAFFDGIQYLIPPTAAPQNTWVQSPVIDFSSTGSISITFEQRYRAFNSDVTYVEFSGDGGTTWTVSEIVNSTVATNATAVQNSITLDIPVNNTATGMIRFRWENTSSSTNFGSGYGWCVDDVSIYAGFGNNMKMLFTHNSLGVQALQYTKFPASQVTTGLRVSYGAEVKNVGYNSQNAKLHASNATYNQTGAGVVMPAFAIDSIAVLEPIGFPVTTTLGSTPVNLEIISDSVLVNTLDDVAIAPFEVTPFVQAVDAYNGTPASISGQFTAFSGQLSGDLTGIGTYFEVFKDGDIGALEVGIANVATATQPTYNGREFFMTILRFNGTDFEYVTETTAKTLETANYGNIVKFILPSPVTVVAGDLIIALANAYVGGNDSNGNPTGGIPIAFSGFAPASTTIGTQGAAYPADLATLSSDPTTPSIVRAPVVRLDYGSYLGLNELESVSDLSVSPNPFADQTTINFQLKTDETVSVTVRDLSGRIVSTIAPSQMNAGKQTIAIDGSAFGAGVYNYTLKVGNNSVTKRMIKK